MRRTLLGLVGLALGLLASCAGPRMPGPADPVVVETGGPRESSRGTRAEPESAEVLYQRGRAYLAGDGVPQDPTEAARWIRQAAEQGHPGAAGALGTMLFQGLGVSQDDGEALTWARRAAEAGDAEGENALGTMLWEGRGLPRDEVAAVRWVRRAAARGHTAARNNLGIALATGRGVERNDREAARWFYLAARGGNALARTHLGLLYRTGRGVIEDQAEAVQWYGKAATQGEPYAQLQLGAHYEAGIGVASDPVRAYAWLALAARERASPTAWQQAGATEAAARRQALAVRLPPAQLAEAERLTEAWQRDRSSAVPHPVTEDPPATWEPPPDHGPLAATALVPREVLFVAGGDPRPRLSPDARRIAFLAPWRGVLNLWVRTLDTGEDRRLTADAERDLNGFGWQCDSEHVLHLQAPTSGGGRWQLHQTAVSTGHARDLTPPGSSVVDAVVGCARPHEALLALRAPERKTDVYRLDLRTGASALDSRNPGDVRSWVWDRHLRVLAAIAILPGGEPVIRVRRDPGSPWRELYRGSVADAVASPGFTPDGGGLYVWSNVGAPTTRLLRMALDTGRTSVLAEDPEIDVGAVLQHPVTEKVDAVQITRARRTWVALSTSVGTDLTFLRGVADGDFAVVSRDANDRIWIVRYELDDRPAEYYRYDRATRRATPLFGDRPRPGPQWPVGLRLAPMRPVSFPARDGLMLHAYLTLPVGAVPRGLPLVLRIHGGPWERSVWGFDPVVQWLANRGYAVLDVNFRGSSGYGRAHLDAGDREWGGAMHTDLLDAKTWAVRQGYARIDQVCLLGGSYGGYATMAALAFSPGEFVCGVSHAGVSDLVLQSESHPENWLFRSLWNRRVGTVTVDAARLESTSPLHLVHEIRGGLLVAHGTWDSTVDRIQSDLMVGALRTLGQPVSYLLLPGEWHSVGRPLNRLRYYALAEQVLARYLAGRVEPAHPHEDPAPFLR